jgi:hypothetical protein
MVGVMDFQIYTMYVNRKDLLINAINALGHYGEKVVILDNSPDQNLEIEHFNGEIIRPQVPLYCNQSYNLIQRMAEERRQETFFVMHSDAKASPQVVEAMLNLANGLQREQCQWGVLFTNYDVFCLMNTETIAGIHWDPYLPLYYTDVDYYYRLKLAGLELIETFLPVEHQEGGSTTVRADAALHTYVQTNFSAWRQYYMEKWGGELGQERFTVPFNCE